VDLLWGRVRHKSTRPLLRTGDPFATLANLCKIRNPDYAKAELVVDAQAGYSIEEMAVKVVQVLLHRRDVLEEK
jgi:shikimate kinase